MTMLSHRAVPLFAMMALLVASRTGTDTTGQVESTRLAQCSVVGVSIELRCGTHWVFEDRLRRVGRRIPLRVIVIPSRDSAASASPVLFVSPGGPGQTNSELIPYVVGRRWHEHRDVVVVDLRGTADPVRLDCDTPGSKADPAGYLESPFTAKLARECRRKLERISDLTQYSTPIVVDDLDEVRGSLGYPVVNLWGASGGTRVVLEYIKRHPSTVRSAIVEGTVPISFKNPLPHARAAQDALDSTFAQCAREAACAAAFAALPDDFAFVRKALDRAPGRFALHRDSADTAGGRISWPAFAEGIRVMSYTVPNERRIPMVIHEAARGNYQPAADALIAAGSALKGSIRLGFLLAITCTEDVTRIREDEIEPATRGTYIGDTRVRAQQAACAEWPRSRLPSDYATPVRSDIPVFILSGTIDPVAPAIFGADAARYLSRSLHVIAPGGHVPGGPCIRDMEDQFLQSGSAAGVDTSCVGRMQLLPFVTRLPTSRPGSQR